MKKIFGILLVFSVGYSVNSASDHAYYGGCEPTPSGQVFTPAWNPYLGQMVLIPATMPVYSCPVWAPGFRHPVFGRGHRRPWASRWMRPFARSSGNDTSGESAAEYADRINMYQ